MNLVGRRNRDSHRILILSSCIALFRKVLLEQREPCCSRGKLRCSRGKLRCTRAGGCAHEGFPDHESLPLQSTNCSCSRSQPPPREAFVQKCWGSLCAGAPSFRAGVGSLRAGEGRDAVERGVSVLKAGLVRLNQPEGGQHVAAVAGGRSISHCWFHDILAVGYPSPAHNPPILWYSISTILVQGIIPQILVFLAMILVF